MLFFPRIFALLLGCCLVVPSFADDIRVFQEGGKTFGWRNGEKVYQKVQALTNAWFLQFYRSNLPAVGILRLPNGATDINFYKSDDVQEASIIVNADHEPWLICLLDGNSKPIDGIELRDGEWRPFDMEPAEQPDERFFEALRRAVLDMEPAEQPDDSQGGEGRCP